MTLFALAGRPADGPTATLKSAAAVIALPVETATRHLPVSVRGVVVAAEPDWTGKFFIQDETAGIFVTGTDAQPAVGDLLTIDGFTSPGSFAPIITSGHWKKIGTAPLPTAKKVTVERLMGGAEDSQRVEITGIVRSIQLATTRKLLVEVSLGAFRVRVFPKLPPALNPQSFVAATVRVRGTAATSFNAAMRQLTAVNLFVPNVDDFVVEQPELRSPFEEPTVPLGDIARYRTNASLAERMHIKGTLTFRRDGQDLFLQDETGGIHVECLQANLLPLGTELEAVGFLEFIDYQPVLKDAVFRETRGRIVPVIPRNVPVSELRNGLHPAEFITLRGKLLDRSLRPVRRDNVPFAGTRVVCTIQSPDLTFTAECEQADAVSRVTSAPLDSLVELQGIAAFETGDDGKPKSFTLLLPSPDNLRILETPSWFTAERLLIGFALVCVMLAGVVGWLLTVAKKNAMLEFLVAEREKSRKELQDAHDLLEERVVERTEQLKVEMTVRKTAELEFRAILTERTRLARELHDTLEQALTGIALQLDTSAKLFQRNPVDASHRLELARGFLRQSQVELRRSIWDLRSRELEQFDLAEALIISSRQIIDSAKIRLELETSGERKRLPEIVEENLLRISQEALTNVVKHSGATLVMLRLVFGSDSVTLEINDNGTGFITGHVADPTGQHFGLLGMAERAKRIGGRLDISGSPGEGTLVRVVIMLRDAIVLTEPATL